MYKLFIASIIAFVVFFSGCRTAPEKVEKPKDYSRPLPPGQLALRRITDPSRIPDFTFAAYDTENLQQAIMYSLDYMSKPSSGNFFPYGGISHEHAVASLDRFAEMLDAGLYGTALNDAIREQYDVYESVGCDDKGTVLFTGYYTPIFEGSMEKTEEFRYPLYSQPDDLVKGAEGKILGKRMPDGSLEKYPPRSVLENSGILDGKELLYLSDPFEVYIAHVQGSAIVRLPDGEEINVGYAANNGYEYKSVAKSMISDNTIPSKEMSLATMIEYFHNNPDKVVSYIQRNPRFVFFQLDDTSPRGSLNTPVTPYRTIATDKEVYPRACLSFIKTKLPKSMGGQIVQRSYAGFTLDQDTGGAIRVPGRCDVYMGIGDKAGELAGSVYQEGRLYYLFLKPTQARF